MWVDLLAEPITASTLLCSSNIVTPSYFPTATPNNTLLFTFFIECLLFTSKFKMRHKFTTPENKRRDNQWEHLLYFYPVVFQSDIRQLSLLSDPATWTDKHTNL